tara:strand:- start:1681 stop:2238 length:558 start_codon:yes stop_codon:yes gene_type:complete
MRNNVAIDAALVALIMGGLWYWLRSHNGAAFSGSRLTGYTAQVTPIIYEGVTPMNSEADWLARTIWGEARGEGLVGMQAVANVIMNRVRSSRFPSTVQGVVLAPWQFSMWNAGEPNGERAANVTIADSNFKTAVDVANAAIAGGLSDLTGGALHYYANYIAAPSWAKTASSQSAIGRHIFLVGVT